jgi:fatty-acid desaturase
MYTTAIVSVVALYVAVRILGVSNTVGFHRLLTHRSFKTKPWLRNTLTLVAALYSGPPIPWVGIHRVHHTLSDAPTDPHTTRNGFWYAHAGWLANTRSAPAAALFALLGFGLQFRLIVTDVLRLTGRQSTPWRKMTKDLEKERFMRFLDAPFVMPAFFLLQLLAAWFIGHWWGILWLWAMHMIVNNLTWAINSVCHWPGIGTSPLDTQDRSRNVGWLNYLTHGESNHNYHHEFPRSACHGLDGESDNSWSVIRLLSRVGLAWDIQLPDGYAEKLEFAESR